MRVPSSRPAARSFSSIPSESGPVVALAPKPNDPPPLTTILVDEHRLKDGYTAATQETL
jgi:hypothetical protein